MSAIPPRRRAVLNFICWHIRQQGFPPTIREIRDHLGVTSTQGIVDHLDALEATGFIRRNRFAPRSIVVLNTGVRT